MKTLYKFCLLFLFCQVNLLSAREPYHVEIIVGPQTANVSAPNLVDLRRKLSLSNLSELIPFYTPNTPTSLNINLRGISALATYPLGSPTLFVTFPNTGTSLVFDGGTRDASFQLFKNYITEAGESRKLLKAYARYSPIDPIAGNPTSLMARMAESDYLLGELTPIVGCDCSGTIQPITHLFQFSSSIGRAFTSGYDTTSVSFPVRYSYSPCGKWAFIVDAPFTYIRNGGASSLIGSLGFGFRYNILKNWSLTSTLRGGGGGSLDLCTSGSFFSTGIISNLAFNFYKLALSINNYAGYFTSTNLWLSGVNFNYHLQNYVFKNGFSLGTCEGLQFCSRRFQFKFTFEDTYFTRNRLFIKHYDEVGCYVITRANPNLDYDALSLGFAYQFGQKSYKGYFLNLAYQF